MALDRTSSQVIEDMIASLVMAVMTICGEEGVVIVCTGAEAMTPVTQGAGGVIAKPVVRCVRLPSGE